MEKTAKVIEIDRHRPEGATPKIKLKKSTKVLKKAEAIISGFQQKNKQMQEDVDLNTEKVIPQIQRELLKSLLQLVPLAEREYKKHKRQGDAYAYNAIVSQIRETITDIQSTNDSQQLLDRILVNILQPQFLAIAQYIIDSQYQLSKSLRSKIKDEDRKEVLSNINSSTKAIARHMDEVFTTIKARLHSEMIDG